jgi:hypothetical protein
MSLMPQVFRRGKFQVHRLRLKDHANAPANYIQLPGAFKGGDQYAAADWQS